jgi:hypothetical protein
MISPQVAGDHSDRRWDETIGAHAREDMKERSRFGPEAVVSPTCAMISAAHRE